MDIIFEICGDILYHIFGEILFKKIEAKFGNKWICRLLALLVILFIAAIVFGLFVLVIYLIKIL